MKDALRSLWRELSDLHTKREENHLILLKRLIGDEQWVGGSAAGADADASFQRCAGNRPAGEVG
jgi:hypothetical protein